MNDWRARIFYPVPPVNPVSLTQPSFGADSSVDRGTRRARLEMLVASSPRFCMVRQEVRQLRRELQGHEAGSEDSMP